MTTANKIASVLRPIAPGGKLMQGDVDLINSVAAQWDARGAQTMPLGEPAWVMEARKSIGQHEIKGPKHNGWISEGWKRLGAGWYNDDETPWCGFAVADWLNRAGLPYPKNFPSAASYASYGQPCAAQIGAIGVKARKGGNHVFLIVGITKDGLFYKALGGNQRDGVNIMDIAVSDVNHIRWPLGMPQSNNLPVMPKGTISTNEA
jgi:uncharacterized protein (TIGR02594 family)